MIHSVLIIAVCAIVTLLIKFVPFIAFPEGREVPDVIAYLGSVLSFSVMGMLVVYCLKNISFAAVAGWAPYVIAVLGTAAVHVWKKNTFLSVFVGTALYMYLIQSVF